MTYTNEELNRMAAGVLGVECWHEIEPKSDNWLQTACIHCGEWIGHDEPVNPDYCNDRNHAVRVAEAVSDITLGVALRLLFGYSNEAEHIARLAKLPAKTLLLAALVAAGKITMDEAKENL